MLYVLVVNHLSVYIYVCVCICMYVCVVVSVFDVLTNFVELICKLTKYEKQKKKVNTRSKEVVGSYRSSLGSLLSQLNNF